MNRKNLSGNLLLLLAALIWGLAFVVQDAAADLIGPLSLNAARSLLATLVLLPILILNNRKNGCLAALNVPQARRRLLFFGLSCGVFLFFAVNLQQLGLTLYPPQAASSSRAGFLTALYVIFVPLLSAFGRKRPGLQIWVAVALTTLALYLLCLSGGLSGLYLGDLVMLSCSLAFSLQILQVDRAVQQIDGVLLSAVQFFVCGILSLIFAFFIEKPALSNFAAAYKSILYLGVLSSGIGYTLQIIGQKRAGNPTVAAILMSMESVFAALGGAWLLSERLSSREAAGCLVLLVAIILAQLPSALFCPHRQSDTTAAENKKY